MKLNFVKVNPVENMTIFVMDKVDSSQHMIITNRLMDYSSIHGEQVGFVEEPRTMKGKSLNTLRLQMMGGEFCGNATRSLAALMVHLNVSSIRRDEDIFNVTIETSGSDELISCQVKRAIKENTYFSKVKMPLPERVSNTNINFKGKRIKLFRVDFPGITHFIVESKEVDDREDFFNTIKFKMEKEDYDAFGIMFFDSSIEFLTPLVYVKATDSKYWERSCASGTSALGIALAKDNDKSIKKHIKQPGGTLEVIVKLTDENISEIFLDGEVAIIAEGTVFIDNQL